MKGATAEPCVSTMRLPNNSRTITIGSNQNFLRSFMNAHSSERNSAIVAAPVFVCSSELAHHMGSRTRRFGDAVRRRLRLVTPLHRIAPEAPHYESHRRHDPIEDYRKYNARVDPP